MRKYKFTLENVRSKRRKDKKRGWVGFRYQLTDWDCEQIAQLLGGRYKTRARVEQVLKYDFTRLSGAWYWDRIHWDGSRWEYCAGQCYTSECAQIRKDIIS